MTVISFNYNRSKIYKNGGHKKKADVISFPNEVARQKFNES